MGVAARVRALQKRTGQRILLRPVHDPRPGWRGQLTTRALWVTIEYQDPEPGYFWHEPLIHELLDQWEAGRRQVTLWAEGAEPPEDKNVGHE